MTLETENEWFYIDAAFGPNFKGDFYDYVYIGATQNAAKEWVWITEDKKTSYGIRWQGGEPSGGAENCLSIRNRPNTNAIEMNDVVCSNSTPRKFVCEKMN